MAIGWMNNVAQADTYFVTRFSSDAWTAASAGNKEAALWTAYYRLIDCDVYNLSDATPTTAPLRRAQCEMAFYLIKHLPAEDHRLGIQAQGVVSAGIVQESYKEDMALPIPAIVDAILDKAGYKASPVSFFVAPIGRDDSKDIDEKVDEYSEQ
jgi:hypothetical protein